MVGTPLKRYFEEYKGYKRGADLFLYDKDSQKGYNDNINLADIIFVSVPTPRIADGSAGLTALEDVLQKIDGEKIIVIKSTVPPGTTENCQKKYSSHKFLFNPEFLTEQNAWETYINPDRQIVGFASNHIEAASLVLSLLPTAPFMSPSLFEQSNGIKITATEAEFIKYGGNVYLARKVAYANAIAKACETMNGYFKQQGLLTSVNYENVRRAMAADSRIGGSHLDVAYGGFRGFGGFCFPKDLSAFIVYLEKSGLSHCAELLKSDWRFNECLLAEQGLTIEDVSVHDAEWIKKRIEGNQE